MIQLMYNIWSKPNGKAGIMWQWTNVRSIKDLASTDPKVDEQLLRVGANPQQARRSN